VILAFPLPNGKRPTPEGHRRTALVTDPTLVDTDILSALMRRVPPVVDRARAYLGEHGRLAASVITRHEILRGLKATRAVAQPAAFGRFCETIGARKGAAW
jgi:hypothetical protein